MKNISKNKKIILVSASSVLAIGATYYFLILRPKTKAKKQFAETTKVVSNANVNSNTSNDDFPLKEGSRGTNVKNLQIKLGVSPDGVFGTITKSALKEQIGKDSIDKSTFDNFLNARFKYAASKAINIKK